MSTVYALYSNGAAAQRAVDALRAAGLPDGDITIISAEPMEEYEFAGIDHTTRLWYIASLGGLVGLAFSTWLTRFTELAWPLPTGNMPIVAWWPNMIVMFELTMLGAILSAVVAMAVAGGLARRRPTLYDRAVSDGQILVGVDSPRDSVAVEHALRDADGAATIKRI